MDWRLKMYSQDYNQSETEYLKDVDEAFSKGVFRINIKFLSLDGLSREEVLSSKDGVVPKILDRSFYLSKYDGTNKSWDQLWASSFKSRRYQYSNKDEVRNQYVYVEVLE